MARSATRCWPSGDKARLVAVGKAAKFAAGSGAAGTVTGRSRQASARLVQHDLLCLGYGNRADKMASKEKMFMVSAPCCLLVFYSRPGQF